MQHETPPLWPSPLHRTSGFLPPSPWTDAHRLPHVNCRKPFIQGLQSFGCGQCMPCRINHRRLWTHRLLLERSKHGDAQFATLTYSDDKLPPDSSVSVREAQLFLKRLRERFTPRRVRYFIVGEYGDETWRPHYHAALFGVPNCLRGRTDHRLKSCCAVCDRVQAAWPHGGVDCRELAQETAQYLVGYVTKKMTKEEHPALMGRRPEFARMSLRPGIGASAMLDVASTLNTSWGSRALSGSLDVPTVLQHGGRKWPLGRYLRRRLRWESGFEEIGGQEALAEKKARDLRALSEVVGTAAAVSTLKLGPEKVRILQTERKAQIWAKRKTL